MQAPAEMIVIWCLLTWWDKVGDWLDGKEGGDWGGEGNGVDQGGGEWEGLQRCY